jgi:hypothetical protein
MLGSENIFFNPPVGSGGPWESRIFLTSDKPLRSAGLFGSILHPSSLFVTWQLTPRLAQNHFQRYRQETRGTYYANTASSYCLNPCNAAPLRT